MELHKAAPRARQLGAWDTDADQTWLFPLTPAAPSSHPNDGWASELPLLSPRLL